MKLYYSPGACSLSPHIVARELALPLQLVKVDMKARRYEGGRDFHEVNPLGYVPVLELEDGALLREGAAIVQFLADKSPQSGLIPPAGTMERVRAQEWLNLIATEFHKQFAWLFAGGPEETLDAQRGKIRKVLGQLDQHLTARSYMLGDRFTVVDAYAFTIANWCNFVKIDLAPYPNVRAFLARVGERSSVRAALAAEGLA